MAAPVSFHARVLTLLGNVASGQEGGETALSQYIQGRKTAEARLFERVTPRDSSSTILEKLFESAHKSEKTELNRVLGDTAIRSKLDDVYLLPQQKRAQEHLTLTKRGLTAFPVYLRESVALEKLTLQNNKIPEIPTWISDLAELRDINLQDNEIAGVPASLGELTKLVFLNLSNNRLASVPPELGKLTKALIDLRNNRLETLPPEFCHLEQFPVIVDNPIVYLPSQLIPMAPANLKKAAFSLESDIASIGQFLENDMPLRPYYDMPIRLQNLLKRAVFEYFHRHHLDEVRDKDPDFGGSLIQHRPKDAKVRAGFTWVLEKLQTLKSLRDQAIAAESDQDKLRIILQMQYFPLDKILFQQQVAEAILEVAKTLEGPLKGKIDAKVPFEKFTLRPCDDSVRRAVLSIVEPKDALERSFYQALQSSSLQDILTLFDSEDPRADRMITLAIEALPLVTKEKIKLHVFDLNKGAQSGDEIVISKPRNEYLKPAIEFVMH